MGLLKNLFGGSTQQTIIAPPSALPPTIASPRASATAAAARQRAALAAGAGFGGTIKTSAQGSTMPMNLATPTLVGGAGA